MVVSNEKPKRRLGRLGRSKEKPKTQKFHWRPLASILIAILAFVVVIAVLSVSLGWPSSLLTLGIMLGVAWLVGAAAGGQIAVSKWPALVATILAVGLATSTLGFGVPWRLGETSVGTGENVWFRMEASFTYRGSEDNLPIENVAIRFPCPNVENVAPKVMATTPSWLLYYMENDNTLTLQATSEQVYGFRGERTATLGILLSGKETTTYGPKIYYVLDKFYPREVFWIVALADVPSEDVDKVTSRLWGDNEGRSSAQYWYPYNTLLENQGNPVDISFWAQLSKKINDNFDVVETFSRNVDNAAMLGQWLYPS